MAPSGPLRLDGTAISMSASPLQLPFLGSVGSVVLARSASANPLSFARYGPRTGPRLAHSSACASICFAITSLPTESSRPGILFNGRVGDEARSWRVGKPAPLFGMGRVAGRQTSFNEVMAGRSSAGKRLAIGMGFRGNNRQPLGGMRFRIFQHPWPATAGRLAHGPFQEGVAQPTSWLDDAPSRARRGRRDETRKRPLRADIRPRMEKARSGTSTRPTSSTDWVAP